MQGWPVSLWDRWPKGGQGWRRITAWLPQPLLAVVPAPGTATRAPLRTQQAEDGAAPAPATNPPTRPERHAAALRGRHVQLITPLMNCIRNQRPRKMKAGKHQAPEPDEHPHPVERVSTRRRPSRRRPPAGPDVGTIDPGWRDVAPDATSPHPNSRCSTDRRCSMLSPKITEEHVAADVCQAAMHEHRESSETGSRPLDLGGIAIVKTNRTSSSG